MTGQHQPQRDQAAIEAGSDQALIEALIALANGWMTVGGYPVSSPIRATSIALQGDTAKGGLLAAGVDLRDLLAQSPQGRKALRDFGFEPATTQQDPE